MLLIMELGICMKEHANPHVNILVRFFIVVHAQDQHYNYTSPSL